jgi:putative addiction module component (TIGR02574 family)
VRDIPNFEQLSDLERLELAEELIASVRNPEALSAPLTHRVELERRWAEYERNPTIGLSEKQLWEQIKVLKDEA